MDEGGRTPPSQLFIDSIHGRVDPKVCEYVSHSTCWYVIDFCHIITPSGFQQDGVDSPTPDDFFSAHTDDVSTFKDF